MKIIKFLLLSALISCSVWADDASTEIVDINEALTNPTINVSKYKFPTASVAGVLHNNGPLINGVGTGSGGLDESILQNNTLGLTSLGAAHQQAGTFRIADDFTITGNDWTIDNITFFAYQTNETASTITGITLQIWDGIPGAAGSNVIFGDETTNIMSSTVNSNILRVSENTTGTSTNRQIAASTATVNTTLSAGKYWLDWASDGSGASGPWAPPITITGQTVTGDALIRSAGVWGPITDSGTSTALGLPFVINGTSAAIIVEPVPASNWIVLSLLILLIGFVTRRYFLVKQ